MTTMKFIAGPCVIESAELLDAVAERLVAINRALGTQIIFKASFDKANRTSITSFRGPGLDRGLQMLADVRAKWGLRLLTDIHESWQAAPVGEVITPIFSGSAGIGFLRDESKSPSSESFFLSALKRSESVPAPSGSAALTTSW